MSEEKTKHPGGRPRTTVDKLPKNWQEIMLECGKSGGSAVKMRVKLGIGISAWETLIADSKEFRETLSSATELCQVWWEDVGQEMATTNTGGNATTWIFNMKNRFRWRDQVQVDNVSSDGSMSTKPVVVNVVGVDSEESIEDDIQQLDS